MSLYTQSNIASGVFFFAQGGGGQTTPLSEGPKINLQPKGQGQGFRKKNPHFPNGQAPREFGICGAGY